ncbi:MAG TPA: hypothetical protein VF407_18245 [Polyangiaceae bacterium]
MSNSKINSWDWDIRVRERNLKNGTLTEKDIEAKDAKLVDLADQADAVTEVQPAIGNGEDDDDGDDEVAGEAS